MGAATRRGAGGGVGVEQAGMARGRIIKKSTYHCHCHGKIRLSKTNNSRDCVLCTV